MTWAPPAPELNGLTGWVYNITHWRHRGRLYLVRGIENVKRKRFKVQEVQVIEDLTPHGPADMNHLTHYQHRRLRSKALGLHLCAAAAAALEEKPFASVDLTISWTWDLAEVGHQARFWTPPAEPKLGQLALQL